MNTYSHLLSIDFDDYLKLRKSIEKILDSKNLNNKTFKEFKEKAV